MSQPPPDPNRKTDQPAPYASILLLGLGNLLAGDDGLGVELVKSLDQKYIFPGSVILSYSGGGPLREIDRIADAEKIIIVDAVVSEGKPGDLVVAPLERFEQDEGAAAHGPTIAETIKMIGALTGVTTIREIILVGIIPADLSAWTEGLSGPVRESMPAAEAAILDLLARWQVLGRVKQSD